MTPNSTTSRASRLALATALTTAAALLLASAAMANGVKFFQSPSHNIGCVIARAGHGANSVARCDIAHRTWQAPSKPHSCHLDYGNGLEVDAHGKGHFTCAGDTVLGTGPDLAYGDSVHFGGYKCKSKLSGMRCRNLTTGHGFKVSIEKAVRF